MSGLLKTLIGGAAGVTALYVVGKVCFEMGRDVAEIEQQLKVNAPEDEEMTEDSNDDEQAEMAPEDYSMEAAANIIPEKRENIVTKTIDKVKNLKMIVKAKQALSGGGREPGVLGTLLKNPEGARIEAFVANGGVRINVRPRAA